jgi:hypothetical protein
MKPWYMCVCVCVCVCVYIYIYKLLSVAGIANAMGWSVWCFYYWKTRPYVWRCALFVVLVGLCMIFEVMDFPPLLWVIDAHSLWHLATAGLPFIFYRYIYILMTVYWLLVWLIITAKMRLFPSLQTVLESCLYKYILTFNFSFLSGPSFSLSVVLNIMHWNM